jgi:hypothetical protein
LKVEASALPNSVSSLMNIGKCQAGRKEYKLGIFNWMRWKQKEPTSASEPIKVTPAIEKEMAVKADENEQPSQKRTTPVCAKCTNSFTWKESYVTKITPGWSQFSRQGLGDHRPRLFCPHCGSLVADWHMTEDYNFDDWIWHGDNSAANIGVPLPPDPVYSEERTFKIVPLNFRPTFSHPVLDIIGINKWKNKLAAREKAEKESPDKPINVQELAAKMDVDALINAFRHKDFNFSNPLHSTVVEALAAIGAPAIELLIAAFKSAECSLDNDTDWDQNLRAGVVQALRKIRDPRGVECFFYALLDYRPHVSIDAARALKEIDEAVILAELSKVRDPEFVERLNYRSGLDPRREDVNMARSLLKMISRL